MSNKNKATNNDKPVIEYIREQLKHGDLDISTWGTMDEKSEQLNKDALNLIERLITDYEKGIKSTNDKELVLNMGNSEDEKKLDELFANKIKEDCFTDDPERDHDNADGILCELLDGLGFVKTVEAFTKVDKYYA